MPDKSKFEQEIDEILEKSEDLPGTSDSSRRSAFEPFSPNVPKRPARTRSSNITLNPSYLIVAGLALLAIAAFTSIARLPVALVGIGLLAIGYYLSLKRGSFSQGGFGGGSIFGRGKSSGGASTSEPQVNYWRGRRIDPKPKTDRPNSQRGNDRGRIIEFTRDEDQDK